MINWFMFKLAFVICVILHGIAGIIANEFRFAVIMGVAIGFIVAPISGFITYLLLT